MDDLSPSIELYRKYMVENSKSKLTIVAVLTRPTRKFAIALHRLRIEGKDPYRLERKTERYLEDHLP